jgi:diacylglycerol kinase
MSRDKNQGFPARLGFALRGVSHALAAERSLRFQLACFALLLIALLVLRPEPFWWAVLLLAGAAVIAAELFNTALEHLADHLHPDTHPQIRIVKDCAAAAVLVSVCGALAAGTAFAVSVLRASH